MARPRTASNILELRGSFAHDPSRRRSDPPSEPLGSAPKQGGNWTFKKAWAYIASTAPAGTLQKRDRVYLEVAAELYVVFKTQGAANMPAALLARMEMMLSKLGLSPADASRVSAVPPQQRSDFDD